MAGDKYEGRRQRAIHHGVGKKFKAGDVGQAEIQQHTIECCGPQCRDTRRTIGRVMNFKLPRSLAGQEPAVQASVGFVVVDDQQTILAIFMSHDDGTPWHCDTR
jgi:hypothetical protein